MAFFDSLGNWIDRGLGALGSLVGSIFSGPDTRGATRTADEAAATAGKAAATKRLPSVLGETGEKPPSGPTGDARDDFLAGHSIYSGFKSSNVSAAHYDPEQHYLELGFKNGGAYGYHDVTRDEARTFYNASSKGNWVWDNLRVRGTVFGYKKSYAYISGLSAGYEPKYYANEKHREEHRRIAPAGHVPYSWMMGKGPYRPEWVAESAPHPEAEQFPMTGGSPHPAAEKTPMGPHVDIDEVTERKRPMAYKTKMPSLFGQHKASGGPVQQQLGDGGDTEPIYATPGEFVVNKQAAQKPENAPILDAINQGFSPLKALMSVWQYGKTGVSILSALGVGQLVAGDLGGQAEDPVAMKSANMFGSLRRRDNENAQKAPDFGGATGHFASGGFVGDKGGAGGFMGGKGPKMVSYGEPAPGTFGPPTPDTLAVYVVNYKDFDFGGAAKDMGGRGGKDAFGGMLMGLIGGDTAMLAGGPAGAAMMAAVKAADLAKTVLDGVGNPRSLVGGMLAPYQSQVAAYSPASVERFTLALDNLSAAAGRFLEPLIQHATAFADELNVLLTGVGADFASFFDAIGQIWTGFGREVFVSFIGTLKSAIDSVTPYFGQLRELSVALGKGLGALLEYTFALGKAYVAFYEAILDPIAKLLGFENALDAVISTINALTAVIRFTTNALNDLRNSVSGNTGESWFGHRGATLASWLALSNPVTAPFGLGYLGGRYMGWWGNGAASEPTSPQSQAMTVAAQPARHIGIEDVGLEARRAAYSQSQNVLAEILTTNQQATAALLQIAAAMTQGAAGQPPPNLGPGEMN